MIEPCPFKVGDLGTVTKIIGSRVAVRFWQHPNVEMVLTFYEDVESVIS
jgi:hypothetical protein